jgi:hypothetical protein
MLAVCELVEGAGEETASAAVEEAGVASVARTNAASSSVS